MDRTPIPMYLLVYFRWLFLLLVFVVLVAICVGAVVPIALLESSHPATTAQCAATPTASIEVLHNSASFLPQPFGNSSGRNGPPAGWMPTMLFLLIVGVLAVGIAYWLRRSELARLTNTADGEPFTSVPLTLAFEPQYAMLWDTQLPALELLDSAGQHGLPVLRLCSCYLETARHYPELYEGCSFPQWLDFLVQGNLVVRVGPRVVLTSDGREFLHMLSSARELSYPQRRPAS